jgi:hypothetical protein
MQPRKLILALVLVVPVLTILIALLALLSGAGGADPQAVDPNVIPDPLPTVITHPFCGSCV